MELSPNLKKWLTKLNILESKSDNKQIIDSLLSGQKILKLVQKLKKENPKEQAQTKGKEDQKKNWKKIQESLKGRVDIKDDAILKIINKDLQQLESILKLIKSSFKTQKENQSQKRNQTMQKSPI